MRYASLWRRANGLSHEARPGYPWLTKRHLLNPARPSNKEYSLQQQEKTVAMAVLSTSASSCGSALAAASSRPAASCSSSSSRTLFLGKSQKVVSFSGSGRFAPLSVRATTSTEEATTTTTPTNTNPYVSDTGTTLQADELLADLKAKWDRIENKTNVFIYGGGALVALWLSATIVGAVNSVPLLPKLLELVGLGYTGWFVYKYLLFKESRKELVEDIEVLKSKISGAGKESLE